MTSLERHQLRTVLSVLWSKARDCRGLGDHSEYVLVGNIGTWCSAVHEGKLRLRPIEDVLGSMLYRGMAMEDTNIFAVADTVHHAITKGHRDQLICFTALLHFLHRHMTQAT